MIDVSFVIPCYRSGSVLEVMLQQIHQLCVENNYQYEVLLVEDCTPDQGKTWRKLTELSEKWPAVKTYKLARNVGQQLAVICGFELSVGKVVVTLDDDGQHDMSEILPMINQLGDVDVVIASLKSRKVGFIRSLGTSVVKGLAKRVFNLNEELAFSSFRVINGEIARRVPELASSSPVVGFELLSLTNRAKNHFVEHNKRAEGQSTYSIAGLVRYFSSMLFGYSNFLPKVCLYASIVCGVLSLLLAMFYLFQYFAGTLTQPGFATLSVLMSASFAITLLMLAVIISLLGKLNQQGRGVPRYIVSEHT